MKGIALLLGLLLIVVLLCSGCATSKMTSERTLTDGTVQRYEVSINSFGQDFAGSDLSATLDPDGQTTVQAGAVDNTTSQVSADVAQSMVEMLRIMLPYLVAPATPIP